MSSVHLCTVQAGRSAARRPPRCQLHTRSAPFSADKCRDLEGPPLHPSCCRRCTPCAAEPLLPRPPPLRPLQAQGMGLGIHFHWGLALESMNLEERVATFSPGPGSAPQQVAYNLLVGADGSHSQVGGGRAPGKLCGTTPVEPLMLIGTEPFRLESVLGQRPYCLGLPGSSMALHACMHACPCVRACPKAAASRRCTATAAAMLTCAQCCRRCEPRWRLQCPGSMPRWSRA